MNAPCVRCARDAAPGHVLCQRCIDTMDVSDGPVFRISGRLAVILALAIVFLSAPWWLGAVALVRIASRLVGVL